jgi:uncharacterized damage-inducible protein DinB
MEPFSRLRRMFAFETWANREALASLQPLDPTSAAASVRLVAHIAATQLLWLARIRAEPPSVAVWPNVDLRGATELLANAETVWLVYLPGLNAAELARPVSYTNTKGERWTNSVADILEHVLLHGHYHRGQIAAQVRAAGGMPAYTDFIHAVRSNSLPPEETIHG